MSVDAEDLIRNGSRFYESFQDENVIPLIRADAPRPLADPMIYSLSAPGKRFRPLLCMLMAGIVPNEARADVAPFEYALRALRAGAALEAIHTYSLIHDDLPCMDDDALRRGRPTCHIAYGEWAAVLAGDALNTLAFRLLCDIGDSAISVQLVRILADCAGIQGMVGGQALDLESEQRAGGLPDGISDAASLLDEIHGRKTAALIAAACEMGACLAGLTSPADRKKHGAFGRGLGLLFQISDDILDEVGNTATLGKAAGQDRAHGKLTYPALHGLASAQEKSAALYAELLGLAADLPIGPLAPEDPRPALEALCRFTKERSR